MRLARTALCTAVWMMGTVGLAAQASAAQADAALRRKRAYGMSLPP